MTENVAKIIKDVRKRADCSRTSAGDSRDCGGAHQTTIRRVLRAVVATIVDV